jgi:hypothetical protein
VSPQPVSMGRSRPSVHGEDSVVSLVGLSPGAIAQPVPTLGTEALVTVDLEAGPQPQASLPGGRAGTSLAHQP